MGASSASVHLVQLGRKQPGPSDGTVATETIKQNITVPNRTDQTNITVATETIKQTCRHAPSSAPGLIALQQKC